MNIKEQIADLFKSYLDDSRLYVDALQDLQGQLSKIEAELSRTKSKPSQLMKDVLSKADTERFRAYVEGSIPSKPQPDLAQNVDENLRLLKVLRAEMKSYITKIEALQENLKTLMESRFAKLDLEDSNKMEKNDEEETNDAGESDEDKIIMLEWRNAAADALLAAGLVDSLHKDFILIDKTTDSVSITTSSAEIFSYYTVIKLQPYFSYNLIEGILSWKDGEGR